MRILDSRFALRIGQALAAFALLGGAPGLASRLPQLVSPGAELPGGVTDARCPTFSWAGVPHAGGYELAVFRLSDEQAESIEPILVTRASVPGDARSFTPRLDQCLERGGRYAWSVAVATGAEDGRLAWTPAHLFEVADGPSIEELEEAMATIQRYLRSRGGPVEVDAPRREAMPEPTSREPTGDDRPHPRHLARRARPGPQELAGDELPGALIAPTITRVTSEANTPAIAEASLVVSRQIHMDDATDFFQDGNVFLWDDAFGNMGLGRNALSSVSGSAIHNTAFGREALRETTGSDPGFGSDNTAVGDRALFLNTGGFRNTATGTYTLRQNTSGRLNTATGFRALGSNTTGFFNTAIGGETLFSNTTGSSNTATGVYALRDNTLGNDNTATGNLALRNNTTGIENTAVGALALYSSNGQRNIALGFRAGYGALAGSYNIFIGNSGASSDTQTIRIGTIGVQSTTFLAGDVGVGIITGTPTSRLHVRDAIDGSAYDPASHVALMENSSTGGSADVLALKVGLDHSDGGTQVNSAMNFVTFLDGNNTILGEIQGTVTGGIELVSGNADFAEWLPRLDPAEAIEPGDVVGLHGGALSKRTEGAARVFVVSTAPIVTGNDPGEEHQGEHARVAFLGQAPVKVRGPVRAGDLLVASGRNDGVAVARAPADVSLEEAPAVVGRALETSESSGIRGVRALIGLDGRTSPRTSCGPERSHSERTLDHLERRVGRLEARAGFAETTLQSVPATTRRR